ncbi:ribosome biogenesis GTPase YlqF, partial [Enterococcus faecalis]
LMERYGLTEEELFLPAPEQVMLISQKRGFRDDYNRASEMNILEIRSGKLGTYTLDRWE